MNGYDLTRAWYHFASQNRRKVKPIHHAIIHWAFQLYNQSKWSSEFQFPTEEACDILGISDKHSFLKALKELSDFGAIKIVEESKNRFTARWVSIEECEMYRVVFTHASQHATVQATTHGTTHASQHATTTNIKHINKETNKLIKGGDADRDDQPPIDSALEKKTPFKPPSQAEIENYVSEKYEMSEQASRLFSEKFWGHYESKGWIVGKTKMKSWQAAVSANWKDTIDACKMKHPKYRNGTMLQLEPSDDPVPRNVYL